ncbi:hypothetical protein [Hymenobacter persicinus]|uniref:VOC family protein n=1 Tax=Hymenobacter persicinus TaxID=2025506 RepID=A0A4Q5L761_9BACT|nr:hypothetical protein [Hymenobacter persicinus]RYU76407.1 hypothetical protein EWM57_18710 [Hymenobacter persicinus]
MKHPYWIALSLLGLVVSTEGLAQTLPAVRPAPEPPLQFAAQKTVLYPIRDSTKMAAAVAWYSSFFAQQPVTVGRDGRYPYAVYSVDGVEVRLETNPRFLQLKEPVFYWVLPTPADVTRKYNSLDANPDNKFERGLFRTVRQLEDHKPDGSLTLTAGAAVTEVREFVVLDPAGNQVGVINNPIYPPTTTPDEHR